jgi:hypothetical protein
VNASLTQSAKSGDVPAMGGSEITQAAVASEINFALAVIARTFDEQIAAGPGRFEGV